MALFGRQNPEAARQAEYTAMSEDEKRQHRDYLLTGLIDDFADKEQENIEQNNPFREKTKKEQLKAIAKRAAIKVGIGVLFAGATVAFGGVPLIAAASAVGSGLVTSSFARGGVDVVRKFSGVEKKENELQQKLAELHKTRQEELRRLAINIRAAESGQLIENGQPVPVEEAKYRFQSYVVEISDQSSAENTEFKNDREKLLKSKKKYRWIKFGASMVSGILAGGAVAEAFRDEIKHVVSDEGFQMAGEGLGRVGEFAGIAKDVGHHVHQTADGTVAFDYNAGELDDIRQVVAEHPDQFAAIFESTKHAKDLAAEGMHEAGGAVSGVFNQAVTDRVGDQVGELWGAVAADIAANELVDNLSQGGFSSNLEQQEEQLNVNEVNRLQNEIGLDLQDSAYQRITGGSPEYPPIGGEVALLSQLDANYIDAQGNTVIVTFNGGDRFEFVGLSRNDAFIVRPIDNRQNQLPADFRIPMNKAAFDMFFLPPRPTQSAASTTNPSIMPSASTLLSGSSGQQGQPPQPNIGNIPTSGQGTARPEESLTQGDPTVVTTETETPVDAGVQKENPNPEIKVGDEFDVEVHPINIRNKQLWIAEIKGVNYTLDFIPNKKGAIIIPTPGYRLKIRVSSIPEGRTHELDVCWVEPTKPKEELTPEEIDGYLDGEKNFIGRGIGASEGIRVSYQNDAKETRRHNFWTPTVGSRYQIKETTSDNNESNVNIKFAVYSAGDLSSVEYSANLFEFLSIMNPELKGVELTGERLQRFNDQIAKRARERFVRVEVTGDGKDDEEGKDDGRDDGEDEELETPEIPEAEESGSLPIEVAENSENPRERIKLNELQPGQEVVVSENPDGQYFPNKGHSRNLSDLKNQKLSFIEIDEDDRRVVLEHAGTGREIRVSPEDFENSFQLAQKTDQEAVQSEKNYTFKLENEKEIEIKPGQKWRWKTESGENETLEDFEIDSIEKSNDGHDLKIQFRGYPSRPRPINEWRGFFEAGKRVE